MWFRDHFLSVLWVLFMSYFCFLNSSKKISLILLFNGIPVFEVAILAYKQKVRIFEMPPNLIFDLQDNYKSFIFTKFQAFTTFSTSFTSNLPENLWYKTVMILLLELCRFRSFTLHFWTTFCASKKWLEESNMGNFLNAKSTRFHWLKNIECSIIFLTLCGNSWTKWSSPVLNPRNTWIGKSMKN